MNHQVGEIRNMVVLMSKRIEALEKKVNSAFEVSNKASRISQIVQEFQIKNIHDQINDTEFNKIHKLFSGASPCLEESIIPDDSDSDEDLLGNLTIFGDIDTDTDISQDKSAEEARIRAYEVACAAASDATRMAMDAIAAVEAIPIRTSLELDNKDDQSKGDFEITDTSDRPDSLVSSMTNQLLSDLYQPSDTASL